jgi:L-iditol 2-dehydrogenase
MKVLRLHAPGDLRLDDEPLPICDFGETLVRVKAVGICGSDLHWFSEGSIGDARLDKPLILGHEFSGVTESGERVAIDPAIPCEHCEWCKKGHPNLCVNLKFAGHGAQDGALREFMAWPQKCLHPLPDSISDADGAMLEPLGVALHAVDLGKIKAGMSVGVFGCGPIGLFIIQLAKLSGATQIIATDRLIHRVEAAKRFGASQAFLVDDKRGLEEPALRSPRRESTVETMRSTVKERAVDVAFEAAGKQEAVDDAFAAVLPGGKVILAGIPDDDKASFSASIARRKGLTIKLVRRMKHTYPRAIELVSKGLVDVRSLVTHRFSLDQAVRAFRVATQREGLKVIIEM